MQNIIATIIGVLATIIFVSSYQLKKRNHIIICNTSSRILYVIQYLLLGAFSGAVLDVVGVFAAMIAQKKNSPFIKKFFIPVVIVVNSIIIGAGLILYKTPIDILPIVGVIFQIGAFWMTKEKHIRIISLLSCPFWFSYNFISGAYGSCLGDVTSFISITVAIFRYDIFKREEKK